MPKPQTHAEFVNDGETRKVRLSPTVLARGVCINFGGDDVKVPKIYFDLLPNEKRLIEFSGRDNLEQPRGVLRATSLAHAIFTPSSSAAVFQLAHD